MDTNTKSSTKIDYETLTVTMSRIFDAPRELVFKVYTDPGLVPQWWGPRYLTTRVDHMDVRPGGQWRFVQQDAEGKEYGFNGVYQEVVPPERIVDTFEYEGTPGHILVETATFEDLNGKTRLTTVSKFETLDDLKGMAQEGMEQGATETFERLGELLEKIQQKSR